MPMRNDHLVAELLGDDRYRVLDSGEVQTLLYPSGRWLSGTWRTAGILNKYVHGRHRRYVSYKGRKLLASRIVFAKVHGSLDPDLVVDHVDNDTTNDHPRNLRQLTQQANIARSALVGRADKWKYRRAVTANA